MAIIAKAAKASHAIPTNALSPNTSPFNPTNCSVDKFVKSKDPWINIVNKDICYDEMYDPKIAWPKESLDRYKKYLETN